MINLQPKDWYEKEKEITLNYLAKLYRTMKNRKTSEDRRRQFNIIAHNEEYLKLLEERIENYDELYLKYVKGMVDD